MVCNELSLPSVWRCFFVSSPVGDAFLLALVCDEMLLIFSSPSGGAIVLISFLGDGGSIVFFKLLFHMLSPNLARLVFYLIQKTKMEGAYEEVIEVS